MNVYDRERIFRRALERIAEGDGSDSGAHWIAQNALASGWRHTPRCKHCPHDIDGHRCEDEDPPGRCLHDHSAEQPGPRVRACECPGFEEA